MHFRISSEGFDKRYHVSRRSTSEKYQNNVYLKY